MALGSSATCQALQSPIWLANAQPVCIDCCSFREIPSLYKCCQIHYDLAPIFLWLYTCPLLAGCARCLHHHV